MAEERERFPIRSPLALLLLGRVKERLGRQKGDLGLFRSGRQAREDAEAALIPSGKPIPPDRR